jgi:hypothetical protein
MFRLNYSVMQNYVQRMYNKEKAVCVSGSLLRQWQGKPQADWSVHLHLPFQQEIT